MEIDGWPDLIIDITVINIVKKIDDNMENFTREPESIFFKKLNNLCRNARWKN